MATSYTNTPIVWPGSGSVNVTGRTSLGYFDDDDDFAEDAPKIAKFVATRLGHGLMGVELTDNHIYTCFEEAVLEYANQVNEFQARENMYNIIGLSTGIDLTQKVIKTSPVSTIVSISKDYGMLAGVGGDVEWKRGYVNLEPGVQIYDLKQWAAASESGANIQIMRVWYEGAPAIQRYYDPYATSGLGVLNMIGEFGWQSFSPAVQFTMMPMYEDVLRLQAIELNDLIRRSGFGFTVRGSKLEIMPVPTRPRKMWFNYILAKDLKNAVVLDDVISDASNAPYQNIQYEKITAIGRNWIRNYTLSLCKETLGIIRSKYQSMPYMPGADVTLDGQILRSEAEREKDALVKMLRESLEQMGAKAQLEKQRENEKSKQEILAKVPLGFFWG